jgi:hypothetical protein
MDIQELRRQNLQRWVDTHSVPPHEKSLFSQLKGGGSFGERLARRLEDDYSMGAGYLDRQIGETETPKRAGKRPLSAEAKKLIQWAERIDSLGVPARKIISHVASILELAESMGDPHNPKSARSLIEEEDFLGTVAGSERPGVTKHATRKRAAK